MALSDELEALAKRHGALSYRKRADTQNPAFGFSVAGLESLLAEVRKEDTETIRQLVEALENSHATLWEEDDDPERPAHAAIAAARARLLEADLAKLTERGAVAWPGIDAQDLRDGGKP